MAYSPTNSGSYIPSVLDPAGEGFRTQGIGQQSLNKLKSQSVSSSLPIVVGSETNYIQTAYDILEDIAKRGVTRPHNLPEAEIQILAAFVLGFNSK